MDMTKFDIIYKKFEILNLTFLVARESASDDDLINPSYFEEIKRLIDDIRRTIFSNKEIALEILERIAKDEEVLEKINCLLKGNHGKSYYENLFNFYGSIVTLSTEKTLNETSILVLTSSYSAQFVRTDELEKKNFFFPNSYSSTNNSKKEMENLNTAKDFLYMEVLSYAFSEE